MGATNPMNTTPESRLLELYDRVAEAPDAIERLRKFVLDLAVRGKLVEQDPEDEPAEELLKQIAAEKARRVKAGEIRKPRDLANGKEIEAPFKIPSTWRWCRLDTVGAVIGGGTPAAADTENFAEPGEGIPWLTPADLGGYRDRYIERGKRDLTEKGLKSSSATMMPVGTVLFTSRAPIGYVAIAANPISTNQGFKSIVPYVADCSRFIAVAMQTFAPEIDAKAPGTTFKEVSGKIVAGLAFPLPPLSEQHRIVAKVDELMTLLDRLESTRTQRETTRARLTTATLTRLTAPGITDKDFPGHARFALDNLTQLTCRPDQIKVLRQTILDLAVRGKLVEQDPTDQPAWELLNRIADEKTQLVKAGLLKAERKTQSPSAPVELFDLPDGWVWTKLGSICLSVSDGDHQPPPKSENGVPFLVISDVKTKTINYDAERKVSQGYFEGLDPIRKPQSGDLLYTLVGSFGIPVPVQSDTPFCIQRHIGILRPARQVDSHLLSVFLESEFAFKQAEAAATGIAQKTVSLAGLRSMILPLPPLAEQHRIVAKVNSLMALCEKLETVNAATETSQARLLEVLLHDSLAQGAQHREAA